MAKSEVRFTGTVGEVFNKINDLVEIGLDVPSISKIAAALIDKGINISGELYTVDGAKAAILEYIKGVKS